MKNNQLSIMHFYFVNFSNDIYPTCFDFLLDALGKFLSQLISMAESTFASPCSAP
jgi:hypothetical protein